MNNGIEVIVEQSNSTEVEVETDDNLISHIKTVVENGVLEISTDDSIISFDELIVRVKMPKIEALIADGGSKIHNNATIKGTNLEIESNSGSEIELDVEYDSLKSVSNNGSNLTISGKALKFETETSTGSTTSAEDLLSNDIIAEATNGSSCDVHPLVSLTAIASEGSSIYYHGTPKHINNKESSGGSISGK